MTATKGDKKYQGLCTMTGERCGTPKATPQAVLADMRRFGHLTRYTKVLTLVFDGQAWTEEKAND
jgi:hypothetical protein